MSKKQEKLTALYREAWPRWKSFLDGCYLDENGKSRCISFPFLINIDGHNYEEAKTKLLFVGQQTNGWGGEWGRWVPPEGSDPIEQLLEEYEGFRLGEAYASPLLNYARYIYKAVVGEPDCGYAWTNVLKVDEKCAAPKDDIVEAFAGRLSVLKQEIEILQPDVLVFFSGNGYDKYLAKHFSFAIEAVETYPATILARLVGNPFPGITYRTYHPQYLQQQKKAICERAGRKLGMKEDIAALVKVNCRDHPIQSS